MYNHCYLGYGYGTSYQVVHGLISMPNMQNGLMELVVQTGIISSIPFFAIILYFLYRSRRTNTVLNLVRPIICLIYVYIVLSSIEITFSILFITISILGFVTLSYCEEQDNNLLGKDNNEKDFR